mmetsp:Transcript_29002/g.59427  ORF Transcript_29002/g.59427 Transcript_29002/m.59427 type:complete len:332 (-) Transcript_29002:391-1386(-)
MTPQVPALAPAAHVPSQPGARRSRQLHPRWRSNTHLILVGRAAVGRGHGWRHDAGRGCWRRHRSSPLINIDGFDFRHEQGPLLLHALVILDLKLHVVQHHLPHVVRLGLLEAIHLLQRTRRHLLEVALRHLLRLLRRRESTLGRGHLIGLAGLLRRRLELFEGGGLVLLVAHPAKVGLPRLLALCERLLDCPQHLYVVDDRLLEPQLLLLHLLRGNQGQLVGCVAHLCEGSHQSLGLVLAEQRERQPELEEALGQLSPSLYDGRGVLGNVLHLRLEVLHVGGDLVERNVLVRLDLLKLGGEGHGGAEAAKVAPRLLLEALLGLLELVIIRQ